VSAWQQQPTLWTIYQNQNNKSIPRREQISCRNSSSCRYYNCPKARTNSLLTRYTLKLFVQGYRKDLEERDLYQVPTTLRSRFLGDQYEKVWSEEQRKKRKPSLVRLLLKCHGLYYFFLGLSQLVLKTTFMYNSPNQ
jgi:hypothetical protein